MKPCPICQMARRLDKGAKLGKPKVWIARNGGELFCFDRFDSASRFAVACDKCGTRARECYTIGEARAEWKVTASMIAEALRVAGTWCGPLTKAVRR